MESYDYTAELIAKWTNHLVGVLDQDRTKVAQRLEAAFRRSLGHRGETGAIQTEMYTLRREGYFGPQPSEQQPKATQVRRRKVQSRMHRVRDSV